MLFSPETGVAMALQTVPDLSRVVQGLAAAGLMGGLLQELRHAASVGLTAMLTEIVNPMWWLSRLVPFLAFQVALAQMLWLICTLLIHMSSRAVGSTTRPAQGAIPAGVAMLSFPVLILVGMIQSRSPVLSLPGLVMWLGWLAVVLYQTARQAYRLSGRGAMVAAALPVTALALLWLWYAGIAYPLVPPIPISWPRLGV